MYIAISNDKFILLTGSENLEELSSEGFTLMDYEGYQNYVAQNNHFTIKETLTGLESKADEYIDFGEKLWKNVRRKIWAVNTYTFSQGSLLTLEQMKSLLGMSDLLEKSLKTGSLKTAKDVFGELKSHLPHYSSIADYATNEINKFLEV